MDQGVQGEIAHFQISEKGFFVISKTPNKPNMYNVYYTLFMGHASNTVQIELIDSPINFILNTNDFANFAVLYVLNEKTL